MKWIDRTSGKKWTTIEEIILILKGKLFVRLVEANLVGMLLRTTSYLYSLCKKYFNLRLQLKGRY